MNLASEHLSRHKCADLFIDTFNYNAQSTAIDSLWAGLPLVTLMGKSFSARIASSLLTYLDMKELIAHNIDEYKNIILDLANDNKKFIIIKKKLQENRLNNRLFDSIESTRNLEFIYKEIISKLH